VPDRRAGRGALPLPDPADRRRGRRGPGRTGRRREATYFGASSFVERATTSISPFLLVLLRLLADTRGDLLGIHLVGPVAGAIVFAAYLVFRLLLSGHWTPPIVGGTAQEALKARSRPARGRR
jgi:hypothetical protein